MKTTPKDFFLQLGIVVALYISAISLINVLFGVVDVLHPDALAGYIDPYSGSIRWAIASLIIFFPVYLLLGWIFNKEVAREPEKRFMGVRKWLSFLTLFITGLSIVIDLVVLLNSFLGGEVTTRFCLKVCVVLIVAGIIFIYYILDLRKNHARVFKTFVLISSILVVASLVLGFSVLGSPSRQRNLRFDAERTGDLQSIQWQIASYWQTKQKLPATLTALNDSFADYTVPTDPQSKQLYEYQILTGTSFKLCATFAEESASTKSQTYPAYPEFGTQSDNWQHDVGHTCFTRTIDPQKFPPLYK